MAEWSRLCGFEPAQHHQFIIQKLEEVVTGSIKRLAVFLPPGSAKSTYSSVIFPPWYLAQRPNSAILAASHNKDLALKFGRQCRNLIDDHAPVLGYSLRSDSQAADDWATTNGSVYFCAGVGGKIAGHRASLGIIDDPFGSIEDADSLTIRDSIWDWYEWNFLPRLKPDAPVVIISTRWHEDDLMGRLLAKQPGRWTVIKIPMEAGENDPLGRKVGERLWAEYFTDEMVNDAKANSRKWQGAYQQEPSPEEGSYFKKEYLVGYEAKQLPKNLTIYCASDHACSTREDISNDPSLLVPFGVDEGQNIWILPDIFWDRADTGVVVARMLEMMTRRDPVAWIAESEHIVKSLGPFLRQQMRERGLFRTRIHELSTKRDKVSKARSIQGRSEMGKVYFPKYAPWWPKAEHELLTFPVGTHDEWPDVLGCIGRYLDQLQPAFAPVVQKRTEFMTYGWLKNESRKKDLAEELALLN